MSNPWRLRLRARVLPALASASLVLASGCSTEPTPSPAMGLPAADGRTLAEAGFAAGELGADGTPVYLEGQGRALVRDGDEARRLVLGELRRAYRLSGEADLRLVASQRDEQGLRYLRLQQLHAGVPVVGAELVLQAEEGGALRAVVGQLAPDLRLDATPAMAGAPALQRAMGQLSPQGGRYRVHEAPALRVVAEEGAAPALAWRALVEYRGPEGLAIDEVFASARDGALLLRHPRVNTLIDRQVHDLGGACIADTDIPGPLSRAEGAAASMDDAVNAAYDNTGATYWFYKHLLGRDSYDDAGATMTSTVNLEFPAGFSCDPDNAAWLPSPYLQMAYGSGDGGMFKNLALSLDVTAHELTHAVTNLTSDLTYRNESGALNEAMSDIFGAGAEAWAASGGGAMGNPASLAASADTWKIGETISGMGIPGGALRFMNNPTADGYSKDYYPERLTGGSDSGGVHGNSGIANLAFYLLSQGGRHPRSKTTVQVKGIGLEKALRIFYLANSKLFTSSTDFRRARYATALAAQTLYGRCSPEWTDLHRAWDAVGVLGSWTLCARPRSGF